MHRAVRTGKSVEINDLLYYMGETKSPGGDLARFNPYLSVL